MRRAITSDTEVPVGGEMHLGDDGEPNGIFLNRAVPLVRNAIPAAGAEAMQVRVLTGLNADGGGWLYGCARCRPRYRHDGRAETLEAEGKLPIRVYGCSLLRDEDLMRRWIAKGPDTDNDSMLVTQNREGLLRRCAGFTRGTPAVRLRGSAGAPGHQRFEATALTQDLMAQAMRKGFQVAIHAIGDAGNREALDILEAYSRTIPQRGNLRHRIEHAQVISPEDLPRLGQLGIIASMEPPHAVEDKTWAEERLGPERVLGAYAWRSLRESDARLTFNSDNPGSDHSIFYGLHSAITRQDKNSQPEGGWYAHESMNADEAVRGYTSWSAYASFRENETGIIDVGRWADLTVMDVDPFVLADEVPADMLQGRILMTDGRRQGGLRALVLPVRRPASGAIGVARFFGDANRDFADSQHDDGAGKHRPFDAGAWCIDKQHQRED